MPPWFQNGFDPQRCGLWWLIPTMTVFTLGALPSNV